MKSLNLYAFPPSMLNAGKLLSIHVKMNISKTHALYINFYFLLNAIAKLPNAKGRLWDNTIFTKFE